MNEKDENFLARWSKRKLSGKTVEPIDDSKEIEKFFRIITANYDSIEMKIATMKLLTRSYYEYELTHLRK